MLNKLISYALATQLALFASFFILLNFIIIYFTDSLSLVLTLFIVTLASILYLKLKFYNFFFQQIILGKTSLFTFTAVSLVNGTKFIETLQNPPSSNDFTHLNTIYNMFINRCFSDTLLKTCELNESVILNYYPYLPLSFVELFDLIFQDFAFTLLVVVAFINLIFLPILIFEFLVRLKLNDKTLAILILFTNLLNITNYSNLNSYHLSYTFAIVFLYCCFHVSYILLKADPSSNHKKGSIFLALSYFFFVAIITHPMIYFSLLISMSLLVYYVNKKEFFTLTLVSILAPLIFIWLEFVKIPSLFSQFKTFFVATKTYFNSTSVDSNISDGQISDGQISDGQISDGQISLVDLLLKLVKLIFTTSSENVISFLLIPLITFIIYFLILKKVFILFILIAFISLDSSYIRDLVLILEPYFNVQLDAFNLLYYGNYYRINFVKSGIFIGVLTIILRDIKISSIKGNLLLSYLLALNLFSFFDSYFLFTFLSEIF
jgi:hypothetical protein